MKPQYLLFIISLILSAEATPHKSSGIDSPEIAGYRAHPTAFGAAETLHTHHAVKDHASVAGIETLPRKKPEQSDTPVSPYLLALPGGWTASGSINQRCSNATLRESSAPSRTSNTTYNKTPFTASSIKQIRTIVLLI